MTIKEIAKLAGVSISTVSKVINNKDQSIAPETRAHVLRIVKEYNYTPYGEIKNISHKKTFVIGILLSNASQNNRMLTGILQAAQDNGYNIMLFDSCNSMDTELKNITSLCKQHIDGVIWEPVSVKSHEYSRYLEEQNIKICMINDSFSPSYSIDYAQMGYYLTQNLISYRHSKLGCLLKKESLRSALVLEGFKKCLYDNHISLYDNMVFYHTNEDYSSKILNQNITGIVSSHFALALDLYERLDKLHYYIPSDLSLVSLKDDVRENLTFPHISSCKIPNYEFGYYICKELISDCENKELSRSYLFGSAFSLDNTDSLEIPFSLRAEKLVVIGSINMDNTFNVDKLPQLGKTTTILNLTTTPGGKGVNQAIGAAKLGREVALIGQIGNDTDSDQILDTLEKSKVCVNGVHRDMHSTTGKAYIYIENNGESTITILPGANYNLSVTSLEKCQYLLKNAGFCLISTEIPEQIVYTAAKMAHRNSIKTILKPAALKSISRELLSLIDIFIPNQQEAAILCPNYSDIREQAEYFIDQGAKVVIITLGHQGCFFKTSQTEKSFPAASTTPTDTTGGADAFICALASYLVEGYSIEKAIQIATYAAAFCVARQGVVNALVDKTTLESLIMNREPNLLLMPPQ